jgi:hypothetical protein
MENEFTLRTASQYAQNCSTAEYVREKLLVKREPFSTFDLQCLLQFVSLRLEKLGIVLRIDSIKASERTYKQILSVFPQEARGATNVIKLAATLAGIHTIADKALDAIGTANPAIQLKIDGERFDIAQMLSDGTPGSGEALEIKMKIDNKQNPN